MSIKSKLIYAFLIAAILPMSIAGWLVFNSTKDILKTLVFYEVDQTLDKRIRTVEDRIQQLVYQAELTSQYPPIQGIIRATPSGVDPIDQSTLQSWKERLQVIFSSIIKTYPYVVQVRYLDETGQELVRVNHTDGFSEVVLEDQLQNKSARPYFKEAIVLSENEYYISPVDLNMENGKIQLPLLPVVRIAVPIVSETDMTKKGIVILNVATARLFQDAIGTSLASDFLIIDETGDFIYNPVDAKKEFGKILETGHNYFKEQPELEQNLKLQDNKWYIDAVEGEYRIWRKLKYDPYHNSRYWVLIYKVHPDTLYAPIVKTQRITLLIGGITLVFVFFMAFILTKSISRPLIQLSKVAKDVSEGNMAVRIDEELKSSKDEIGELASAFDEMQRHLIEANANLEEKIDARTKELRQSNEELEQFAYVASHDLQEPVRKVVSYAQLFEKKFGNLIDEEGKQYINFMVTGAKRMKALIQDFLEYSRVGKGDWMLEKVSLDDVVLEALNNLEFLIKENNAKVHYKNLPTVEVNRVAMVQLMQNIIHNAIKYRGDVDPVIDIGYSKEDKEYVVFVKDNGIGIRREHLEQIFVIFEKLHGDSEYEGAGVGLALCKRIVQKHGGKIWAEASDSGAVFKFTLKA